jgi:hypothetical protein
MPLDKVELLDWTGVVPGAYTNPDITVRIDGRIASISSGSVSLVVVAGGVGCYMLARSFSVTVVPGGTTAANNLQPMGWFGNTSTGSFDTQYTNPYFTGTWQCIHGAAPNNGVQPSWGGLWQRIA